MAKTKVAVVKGSSKPTDKELDVQVRKAIEMAGGLKDIVKKGNIVIIKPNIVDKQPVEKAVTTDPRVCKTIADMVKELGGKPIIGEASSIGVKTAEALEISGYARLRAQGYTVLDFTKEETVTLPIPKGKKMKECTIPKVVAEADVLIDVPKMKTHDQCQVTLALKNIKGILLDKGKRSLHHVYGIFDGVADVCTVKKPDFSVIDAIVGMEGLGPTAGDPVPMGLIIAGKDPVAVDAVGTKIMGFETSDNGCIAAAEDRSIGTGDLSKIEVVGEPIDKVKRKFKTAGEAMGERPLPKDFVMLMDEKTCTGCRLTVNEVFMEVEKAGQLDRTSGWTMVVGKVDKLPDVDPKKLVCIGACTAKFKNKSHWVQGCPPNNRDVCRQALAPMGITVVCGIDIDSVVQQ
jgi:uncharacterized protein (DUF362 family)